MADKTHSGERLTSFKQPDGAQWRITHTRFTSLLHSDVAICAEAEATLRFLITIIHYSLINY